MINKVLKIFLLIFFTITFSACEDKKSSSQVNKEKKEVKFTPKLPIPEWDDNADKKITKYWSNRNNAKHDPIPATKIGYAYSEQLHDYKKAIEWFKYSNSMKPLPDTSNYMCFAYQKLKQYDEAIKWCEDAIKMGSERALNNIANLYYDLEKYEESIKYYKKASDKKDKEAMFNLGLIYKTKLEDYKESEKWYLKAISNGNMKAYKNLARMYFHNFKNSVKASAYVIALIDTKYTKSSVIKLLKDEWKIPNETIKKGYELQLNSDEFPIKYKGELGL